MSFKVVATHKCDICGKEYIEAEEMADYWLDFSYAPPVGWVWKVNDDNTDTLFCPTCLAKETG